MLQTLVPKPYGKLKFPLVKEKRGFASHGMKLACARRRHPGVFLRADRCSSAKRGLFLLRPLPVACSARCYPKVYKMLRTRYAFALSLAFALGALGVVEAARHQLAWAIRLGHDEQVSGHYFQFGTFLLYASWVMAIGAAELLASSRRNHEPDSPWPILVLLMAFLYLGLVR